MYGIVEIGGHQYQVNPGKLIDVDKLEVKEGEFLNLDKVLFIGGNADHQIGTPVLTGAYAKAKVIRHVKGPKLTVFRRKPGAFQKKNGHRQEYTCLLITELADSKGQTVTIDDSNTQAKKYLA